MRRTIGEAGGLDRNQRLKRPPELPVWPDRVLSPATSFGVGLAGLSLKCILP